jgi:hypothetical protein
MPSSCNEPTIHDLLSDPLTQAVMQADRVDPLALKRMLGSVAVEIQSAGRQGDYVSHWQKAAIAQPAGGLGVGQWFRAQICGAC